MDIFQLACVVQVTLSVQPGIVQGSQAAGNTHIQRANLIEAVGQCPYPRVVQRSTVFHLTVTQCAL